jgi:hypothetical protein
MVGMKIKTAATSNSDLALISRTLHPLSDFFGLKRNRAEIAQF